MGSYTATRSNQAFAEPMVSTEFAYSPLGALAAIAAACAIAALLYALVLWPQATVAWIAGVGTARWLGRGPVGEAFR